MELPEELLPELVAHFGDFEDLVTLSEGSYQSKLSFDSQIDDTREPL